MFKDLSPFSEAQKGDKHYQANRVLLSWLADDSDRAALYQYLRETEQNPVGLEFQSCADTKANADDLSAFHQNVWLLTSRNIVNRALTDEALFSNEPYQALGSGTFMLGLAGKPHQVQREFAHAVIQPCAALDLLANLAFRAAATGPLKQRRFDLCYLAEQAALRLAGYLFGVPNGDHLLLEAAMRAAYRGLNYQIIGRHFVVADAEDAAKGKIAAAKFTARLAAIISGYQDAALPADDAADGKPRAPSPEENLKRLPDDLREFKTDFETLSARPGMERLKDFKPVCEFLAEGAGHYSGTELAIIVAGMIAGTIGNIQASVSIAINQFFQDRVRLKTATRHAREAVAELRLPPGEQTSLLPLEKLVMEALRLNPPAAFLPREMLQDETITLKNGTKVTLRKGQNVILAMGAATQEFDDSFKASDHDEGRSDPLILGGAPHTRYIHNCIGDHIAKPVITRFVRDVLNLPDLDRTRDPNTGEPCLLQKTWGIMCSSFPMQYSRDRRLIQQPLNVIMPVKTPVPENAELLKKIIGVGAPRIEYSLDRANHVHFAWFVLLENDTKLALFTTYDGDFDAYIEHFALQVGSLFDKVFEHIQHAPPRPVKEHPKEFVDTIRRFNVAPVAGYFYSAYPRATVAAIRNATKGAGA